MNHLGTKILETNRLILRRFNIDDAGAMYENWANDPDVTKYLTWPPHKSIEVSKAVLNEWIAEYQSANYYQWAIILKSNRDKPIGSISIVHMNEEINMVHVGYCIGKKWWHQGITTEALIALIKFFMEDVGANRIESRHDPRNPNSGKVMMKCGLDYEGTMRQGDLSNQGICDYSMYGLISKDYFARKTAK